MSTKKGTVLGYYIIVIFLLLAEWLFMLFAPTLYYAHFNTVETYATVNDVNLNDENGKYSVNVSYEYDGMQYENVYYLEGSRFPSKGSIITIKINGSEPSRIVNSFITLVYKASKFHGFLILAASFILLWSCIGTIFKKQTNADFVDRKWVMRYIRKRELLRMLLASSAILLNYAVDTNGLFYAVFTVSAFIILRAVTRIVMIGVNDEALQVSVSRLRKAKSEVIGRDLDSSTLTHSIITEAEEFIFYGYGSVVRFTGILQSNDKILIVRFGKSMDPYMLVRLEKTTEHSFDSTKQKVKRKPFYIRILPVVALVIVWMILPGLYSPQCEHDFHERTVFKPSTTSDGLAEKMCAKCYESDSINLPRLENIIDAKVTEKTADYLEYGGTLDSIELNRKELKSITFSLELTNTGDVSVKNLTGSATVYNQNDEELGSFQFQMSSEILPGETVSSEAEKSYFWMLQADPLDKLYANQLASADLNELRFDFEIQYE